MRNYSLDDWLLFATLAQENSFSRAAKKLNIDVSALSKRIARLEQQLGTKLLLRTTRQMALTEAGRLFYQRCLKLQADVEDFTNHLNALQHRPTGKLKVKAPLSFGHTYLVPVISEFLQLYPDISLELVLGDQSYNLLKDNIDVLINIKALENQPIDLVAKQIGLRSSGIFAAPSYLERYGVPQHPLELPNYNCLLHRERNEKNSWRFMDEQKEISVDVKGSFKVNSNEALMAASCAGLGLAKLPSFSAKNLVEQGKLIEILSAYKLPANGIYAMYVKQLGMPTKTKLFIDFLRQRFSHQLDIK